jgi:hypothetical protein
MSSPDTLNLTSIEVSGRIEKNDAVVASPLITLSIFLHRHPPFLRTLREISSHIVNCRVTNAAELRQFLCSIVAASNLLHLQAFENALTALSHS